MRRFELGPAALTIGRAESCDIRLDVPGVDDEHAKISEVALIAIGSDCAVGDVPLDQGHRRLVMPGDEIQIGSVVVALEGHDPSLIPPSPDALGRPRPRGPRVRVVEGANFGDELALEEEGREYVIGRAAKCDLVLEDREVSREHLTLVRRGYSVFIKDLTSTRGSWLGRSAVYTGATIEWTRPRMLKVGASVLSLELPAEIRGLAPAAQPSAPMTPEPRSRSAPPPSAAPSTQGAAGAPPGMLYMPPSGPSLPRSEQPAPPSSDPRRVGPQMYAPTPAPAAAAVSGPMGYGPMNPGPPMPPAGHPMAPLAGPPSTAPIGPPAPVPVVAPARNRKAWKKTGPTIGRGSGLLLLALAGLAILGALFVVFSLLE
jgi:pSer/pThr/pTyr-binding forkhead associated (FHA) protein